MQNQPPGRSNGMLKGIIIGVILTLAVTAAVLALANAFLRDEATPQAVYTPVVVSPEQPAPEQTSVEQPVAQPAAASATDRDNRPTDPAISRERAEQIAIDWLAERDITDTHPGGATEMDFEQGSWTWEVDRENRTHYWDIYVDVMTGEVVHYDSGRD